MSLKRPHGFYCNDINCPQIDSHFDEQALYWAESLPGLTVRGKTALSPTGSQMKELFHV